MNSIIFDLDGTLWNSTYSILNSWNNTLSKYDEVKEELKIEDIQKVMGLIIDEIGDELFPYIEKSKRLEIMRECVLNENESLDKSDAKVYDEVIETLKKLKKNYRLFIVSNCEEGYIEKFLELYNLETYFEDFESAGNTGMVKGENIKLIIDRNNIKKAVYIGDTLKDYEASKYAQIPFVYASYGFGNLNNYDFKIDKFSDILSLDI